jgi:hypothetical protein
VVSSFKGLAADREDFKPEDLLMSRNAISAAIAVAFFGAPLSPALAGNYCYLGPGMGCGNTSGQADSTNVHPVGPAPPLTGGILRPSPSLDALSEAALAASNGQLPKYSTGYGHYGPLPSGYRNVLQLPMTTPGTYSSTDVCGAPTPVYPFLAYNGTSYVVDFWTQTGQYCSCFPAGALVLMADGSEREIQLVRTGDWLMGADGRPVQVQDVDRPVLRTRRMMAFADGSQTWSEEHSFWTRDAAGAEWLWAANADQWRHEVEVGHIGGLRDNRTMRTGAGYQFAHLAGWLDQVVIEAAGYGPDTQLYLPRTDGVPIIVNGYVVGAGINQAAYDYESFRWAPHAVAAEITRQAIARVLRSQPTHAARLYEMAA